MNTKPIQIKDPFVEALLPEGDETVRKTVGVTSVMALAAAVWASTITFKIISKGLMRGDHDPIVTVKMDLPQDKPAKPKPKNQKSLAGKSGKMGSPNDQTKSPPKRNPMMSQTVLEILKTKTSNVFLAENIMDQKIKPVDLVKTLRTTSRLVKSGQNAIGAGDRRDKVNAGFNPDGTYGNGQLGSGGLGESLTSLLGGPGRIGTGSRTLGLKAPPMRTIELGDGGGTRSKRSIMSVIRARMPGLRHVYNQHLKQKPGFEGKVTVRMTISPSGKIISISQVSSTTRFGTFDQAVLKRIKKWTFEKIQSGNTTVTVPFTFAE